jgi:hypothetical protein
LYSVIIFIDEGNDASDPAVLEHNVAVTIKVKGTMFIYGSYWTEQLASVACAQAKSILMRTGDLSRLARSANSDYRHHAVGTRQRGRQRFDLSYCEFEFGCAANMDFCISASYTNEREAKARVTQANGPALPRHNRDQFGES